MRRLVAVAGLLLLCLSAAPLRAGTIADLNTAAVAAFNANDIIRATELTLQAAASGDAPAWQEPGAYLETLKNLIFLYSLRDPWPAEMAGTIDRALAFAEATGQVGQGTWMAVINAHAAWQIRQGQTAAAMGTIGTMLRRMRGTDLYGYAAAGAVDLYFMAGDYGAMLQALRETVAITGGSTARTTLDQLYERQAELEQAGDIAAVSALIDARILLVGALVPQMLDEFSHAALWTKFYMNHQAENFGIAADALRVWATTGQMSEDERAFLSEFADSALLLTQLSGYGDQSAAQLGYAQLTVTPAELVYEAGDHRRGLALRERAAAETGMGQLSAAEATLQDALSVLRQTPQGRAEVYLVLSDLAANAWQQGRYDLAADLYRQSDDWYDRALEAGADPLGPFDLAIEANNWARLAIDRADAGGAADYLATARYNYEQAGLAGPLKANQLTLDVTLLETSALLHELNGATDLALADVQAMVAAARNRYAPTHPDRAMALTNAADMLFVLSRNTTASELLGEAARIAEVSMPYDAPNLIEIHVKQALAALIDGDRRTVIETMGKATQARKSPRYRANLREAAENFEILAWALLDDPEPQIDAALEALQWTQVSQSAEALAMMGARLSAAEPGQAVLLRTQQNLLLEIDRNRSALLAAYAGGDAFEPVQTELIQRQDRMSEQLARLEDDIAQAGLDLTGLARIETLDVAAIQALLQPGEVLVTFLLPGLRPDMVAGLERTSNFAIAVTPTDGVVAPIPEVSRGALNRRIAAFRCEMALSDGDCGGRGSQDQRGAMVLDDEPEPQDPPFDWQIAHRLYLDLFGGLDGVLAGADHVIIAPPGDLLRLPFHALITRPPEVFALADADWFIRSHAISVIPSVAALAPLRRGTDKAPDRPRRMLGLGDPRIGSGPPARCGAIRVSALRSSGGTGGNMYAGAYEDGLPLADPVRLSTLSRLPDSACELQSIAGSVGAERATLLLQQDATETRVKDMNRAGGLAAFDILVFATHGLVAGETSAVAPGLVLSPPAQATLLDDGLLTAAEVAALTLDADLVVLSACNTAAGDQANQDGLSGLARAFFHAGARSLMVTHWAVYSDAAVQVSTGVFAALDRDPSLTNAAALRQSVLAILADPTAPPLSRHPAFWAAFAIVGG